MNKVFIPPIKIQGIKTKLIPIIADNIAIDENTLWIEPFMGSGVVGFNLAPKNAIFADLNPYIIQFYKAIQNKSITASIARHFLESEGEKLRKGDIDYYYEVRARFNAFHEPLDFLFLNRSCFNGMIRFNKDGIFNVPYGHKPERFAKAYITKIVNQISFVEERIHQSNWQFLNVSFSDSIALATSGSFIYCDPPYIGRHVDYFDSWNEDDEQMLHNLLISSGAKFMVSTWDHNEYRTNDYLTKCWSDCRKVNTNHFYFVGAKEENRVPMIEALLMNYDKTQVRNIQIKPKSNQSKQSVSIQRCLPFVSNVK